jgi:hypothetical protein
MCEFDNPGAVKLGYDVIEGTEQVVSLLSSVALKEAYGKSEGKYLRTKYRSVGILLHVNTMIYFKFKVQLKLINHENYSSIILNFHTGVGKKYINWKI